MKTGIFYGSSMGTTEILANDIAVAMGVDSADVHNVSSALVDDVQNYDCILLGSSTWGLGELQDDWYDFLEGLKGQNLAGKKVGLFGTGDAEAYPDTFCDALGIIYDAIESSGCEFVGSFEPTDYAVTCSAVCKDGIFVGLAIDDSNESDLTEDRIKIWVAAIKAVS